MKNKVECPECLSPTPYEELNMFGGVCEACTEGHRESEYDREMDDDIYD